jgi:lipopolysaccharide/colanic/teichoic acid biosynthesis glycosyltransferase
VSLAEIIVAEGPEAPALRAVPAVRPLAPTVAKRVFDVVVAIPLCVVALPIIVVCGIVLAIQLRAWPGFVHDRVGQGGATISVPKLRTLPRDFPQYADKTATPLRPVSRFAALLRRTHLDELPQLFLVPAGRLSLVGPRPLMVAEAELCEDVPYLEARVTIPQGCTGLWQVGDRAHERASDAPEFDRFYLRHQSLRLDLWILWRTVARGFGARPTPVADVPAWLRRPA